jgi:hypothetical protein
VGAKPSFEITITFPFWNQNKSYFSMMLIMFVAQLIIMKSLSKFW